MVRIIQEEPLKAPSQATAQPLAETSKMLLQVIGFVIADKPQTIRELLDDYGIGFEKEPGDKELAEALLFAIGACDRDFNSDLASIILDCTLESAYDSFDFKALFSKNKETDSAGESSQASGGGGGLWAGIANAVGGIGGAIGQGLKGKQAREQATANTLQGMYAYKSQVAATEQSKSKNNLYILFAVLAMVSLAVTGLVYFSRRQQAKALAEQQAVTKPIIP